MKRVALFTLNSGDGGQRQYESAVLAAVVRLGSEPQLDLVRARSLRSTADGEVRLPLRQAPSAPLGVQHVLTRAALRRFDLVHRCDLRLPSHPREVLTIHDTAWVHFVDAPTPAPASLRSVASARAVLAPSRFAADEIAEHLGRDDVIVALNGVDARISTTPPAQPELLTRWGLNRPFVLCSGGNAARKNVASLLAAWDRLGLHSHQLALTGTGVAIQSGSGVVRLGELSRPDYLAALAAADLVVVPSTYEGFGLPAVEAMAAGIPVIASDRASLPEVCGDAALLVEPTAEGLAEGLAAGLHDDELRSTLVSRGRVHVAPFTWERSAQIHLELYRSALSE